MMAVRPTLEPVASAESMSGPRERGKSLVSQLAQPSHSPTARLLAVTLVVSLLVLWPSVANAYPWMIKHGFSACSNCHDDPSGGELLTEYGRGRGDELLAMQYGKGWEKQSQPLWGKLQTPDGIRVGGSYRHLTLVKFDDPVDAATFPMQADLYASARAGRFRVGASIGASRVPAGSPHARAAQLTSAEGDRFNLVSRSHWLGYEITPRVLLRAGRLNLPFGVRIPEHVSWVRNFSRTDRESDQHHGLALAFQNDRMRGEVMAILGNYQIRPDQFRERGAAGFVEVVLADRLALGFSSLATGAGGDPITMQRGAVSREATGFFARVVPLDSLVVLAEADLLLATNRDPGYLGFFQVDHEPWQGLHLLATGELADEGRLQDAATETRPGFGEPRFGGWLSVDWYFLPQFSLRVDGVARQDDPFTLLSQLHVYL